MGARGKNFYNDYAKRLGYEEAAVKIQDPSSTGARTRPPPRCPTRWSTRSPWSARPSASADRLEAWKAVARDHKVGTLVLTGASAEALRVVAEAVL